MRFVRVAVLVVVPSVGACSAEPKPVPASTTPPSAAPVAATPSASSAPPVTSVSASSAPPSLTVSGLPLLDGKGDAGFDYIAYERARDRIWLPYVRGDAGYVDVFDVQKHAFSRVATMKTTAVEKDGKKRTLGPSAAAIGDGVVFVGNRGTHEICPIDATTLAVGKCLALAAAPDAVVYVASTKEVWATTPKTNAIVVLDAGNPKALKQKATFTVDGAPEGFAVDDANGFFYTNLEDKDRTLRVDVKARKVVASWAAGCGEQGPRGLRVDTARGLVLVACTDQVRILDAKSDGALAWKLPTGAGVDDVEYVAGTKTLYVAAGKDARLTVARIDDAGPALVATATTAPRARNAVVDAKGNAYVIDPAAPRLLVVSPP